MCPIHPNVCVWNTLLRAQNGRTPLMHACASDPDAVSDANVTAVVNVLLRFGAGVGIPLKNNVGWDALEQAIMSRRLCAVEVMAALALESAAASQAQQIVGL